MKKYNLEEFFNMCGSFYLIDASVDNNYDYISEFYEGINNKVTQVHTSSWLNSGKNYKKNKSDILKITNSSNQNCKRAQKDEPIFKRIKIKDILKSSEINFANSTETANNANVIALKHFIANIKVADASDKKQDDKDLISRSIFNNVIMTRFGNKTKCGESGISLKELDHLATSSLKEVACKCLDMAIEEKYLNENFTKQEQVECSDIEARHIGNNEFFTNENEEMIFKQVLASDYKRKDADALNNGNQRSLSLRNVRSIVSSAQELRSYINSFN